MFFFKQKTAYEIKECDWSSDVCSSDLSNTNEALKKKAETLLNNLKLKQCKIACFSSNNDSQTKGYLRSRMWSQYGENHEGICLVISKQALNTLIDKTYKLEAVSYVEEPFPLLDFDFNYHELKQTPLDMFCDKYFENKYKKLFFTKIIDYRDEAEFRLLKRDRKSVV